MKRTWSWREERTSDGQSRRVRDHQSKPGEFPWDDWYCAARAAGVDTEIALLGSIVMRVSDQHAWSGDLQAECGWDDDGAAMLAFALRDPAGAQRRWQELLDADTVQGSEPGR